jgi:hypothetical protein
MNQYLWIVCQHEILYSRNDPDDQPKPSDSSRESALFNLSGSLLLKTYWLSHRYDVITQVLSFKNSCKNHHNDDIFDLFGVDGISGQWFMRRWLSRADCASWLLSPCIAWYLRMRWYKLQYQTQGGSEIWLRLEYFFEDPPFRLTARPIWTMERESGIGFEELIKMLSMEQTQLFPQLTNQPSQTHFCCMRSRNCF